MKSKKGIKKLLMALALVLCVAAFVPATASVQAEAKTKSIKANTNYEKNYKKSPAVKLGVTYKVSSKKNRSAVKFTAPKAGTYKVTISNVASAPKAKDGVDIMHCNAYINKPAYSGRYLFPERVITQGGKSSVLWITTNYCYNKYYKGKKVKTSSYLASRYGKIKLKKGETIYISFSCTSKKNTYNLKVTK